MTPPRDPDRPIPFVRPGEPYRGESLPAALVVFASVMSGVCFFLGVLVGTLIYRSLR